MKILFLFLLSFNLMAVQTARMPNGDSFQAIAQGTTLSEATTGSSADLFTVAAGVDIVRIAVTKATYIKIGDSTAVTSANGMLMPDGAVDYFACKAGDIIKHLQVSEAGIISGAEGKL